ncbi:hypothetical protein HL670_05374 [Serratia plymuthica]|nr:hypothetical protein [Serratia plymuthica]QJW58422.1 hypothetical protein HL670_05374 [Serratia plymuthica]
MPRDEKAVYGCAKYKLFGNFSPVGWQIGQKSEFGQERYAILPVMP